MSDEIELKLSVPRERVAALKRSGLLRSLSRGRATTRRLTSVYFDTPDLALARNAMALRIRHDGRRRVQTLKLPRRRGDDSHGGLHVHRELECEISGDRPDLRRIDDEALQSLFEENGVAAAIAPVFVTEFDRSVRMLYLDGSEIEFALDLGEIKARDRVLSICEAELELRSGNPRRLFELALALNDDVPLRLEQRTKAARGYGMLSGAPPRAERARPVRLDPAMTARSAFVAIARNCLAQMRANEACAVLGQDPEGVHQMRVAVRRLRALVAVYGPSLNPEARGLLAPELRWLQRQLGPAREWDVFVEETLPALRASFPDEAVGLGAVAREAARLRDAANERARSAITAHRYTNLLLRIELWLGHGGWAAADRDSAGSGVDRPVTPFAEKALDRRRKRMLKLGGRRADLAEPELHRLRLLGKKLRYAAEFFHTLYPRKGSRRYLAALTAIQDTLGALNDAAVTRGLLAELEARLKEEGAADAEAMRALGIIRGWQAARLARGRREIQDVWTEFRACKPFWVKG